MDRDGESRVLEIYRQGFVAEPGMQSSMDGAFVTVTPRCGGSAQPETSIQSVIATARRVVIG